MEVAGTPAKELPPIETNVEGREMFSRSVLAKANISMAFTPSEKTTFVREDAKKKANVSITATLEGISTDSSCIENINAACPILEIPSEITTSVTSDSQNALSRIEDTLKTSSSNESRDGMVTLPEYASPLLFITSAVCVFLLQ